MNETNKLLRTVIGLLAISAITSLLLSIVALAYAEETEFYSEQTDSYLLIDNWYKCENGAGANIFVIAYFDGYTYVQIVQFDSNGELTHSFAETMNEEQLHEVVNDISNIRYVYEEC